MHRSAFVFTLPLIVAAGLSGRAQSKKDYTQYVNPFIGTAPRSASLSGSVFPGACVPFGLVQLSPDTYASPDDPASAYNYEDSSIVGFSHTHLSGTGVADLYDILVQPITGLLKWVPGDRLHPELGYRSRFSHASEKASPGYYRVFLSDYKVLAELTATSHVGFHRYTFPATDSAYVLFDLDHSLNKKRPYWVCHAISEQVRVKDAYTLEGYRILTGWAPLRRVYFVAKFSQPIREILWNEGKRVFTGDSVINHMPLRVALRFDTRSHPKFMIKVALSTTSLKEAYLNMNAELPGWNFRQTVAQAKAAWNRLLARIDIRAPLPVMETFYTGLYHNFIQPNNLADADGSYLSTDMSTHKAGDGFHYSTFSLWDTYRATDPLYALLYPQKDGEFVRSMLRQYKTFGYLPIWQLWGEENYCMIGNHAIPVIADAILKGIPGFNYQEAYKACKTSASINHPGSPFSLWRTYHYFPENLETQSVSMTLEDAFDDWCVAQIARKLGYPKDYQYFSRQAGYYRNVYDPQSGFFRAKNSNGTWIEPFDPMAYGGNGGSPFTEGNAWQYRFYVPQNIPDMIHLMGGASSFCRKLDSLFTATNKGDAVNGNASGFIGQYAHGNEPSHHVAYLYDYAGQAWKTQYYVHRIMTDLYDNTPKGLCGNEDCGQMSAWYVFSALGFYPVNPAAQQYALGSPLVSHAVLHLPDGKRFVLSVQHAGAPYIQSVKLNGQPYHAAILPYARLSKGGELDVVMGTSPNTSWMH